MICRTDVCRTGTGKDQFISGYQLQAINKFLYIFLYAVIFSAVAASGDQLIQVHTIFRHGDRSPISSFPNNPVPESNWPQGFGQLSQRGMQEEYNLGKFLRKRYIEGNPYKLINSSYLESEVYVRSTDIDRTLMSVYSNLAGLFPPSGEQIWNKNLSWQPIPVHTMPFDEDHILIVDNDCPRYNKILQKIMDSEAVTKEETKLKEFFEYVYKESGLSGPNARSMVKRVSDSLFCQVDFGISLPDWAKRKWDNNETTYDKMIRIRESEFNLEFNQPGEARYKGGPFIGLILQNMTDLIQKRPSKKLFMYSSHDTTLIAVMSAVYVYNRIIPHYASCLMFELFNSTKGRYIVRLFYRNDSSSEPYQLLMPGCQSNCSIEQFIELTRSNVPLDYDSECVTGLHLSTVEIVLACCVAVSSLVIILLICCLVRSRRRKDDGNLYMKLNNFIDE